MIEQRSERDSAAVIDCDLCIIGAGAAGIALARALIGSGIDCVVLESGGLVPETKVQKLGALEIAGLGGVDGCQLRYLGGATNHWGGWCRPLDGEDFEARAWVANSGWPIDRTALDPYYPLAQQICGLPAWDHDVAGLETARREFHLVETGHLRVGVYQFSLPPLRFAAAYQDELAKAGNVRVLLHANVTHLLADPDGRRVTAAQLRGLDGSTASVRARRFVLAGGGFENSRLLLYSNRQAGGGFGNDRDQVGRYFLQHPHLPCASLLSPERRRLVRLFGRFVADGMTLRANVGAKHEVQRSRGLLTGAMTLDRLPDPVTGVGAARSIWRDIREGEWPDEFGSRVWKVLTDLDSFASSPQMMSFYARVEQAPNADSRITLSEQTDALGQPLARVDWRLTELDKRSLRATVELLGAEFARLRLGRVRLPDWLIQTDDSWPPDLWGGCHLMGGTRMSDDAGSGVVDRDCRVHGMQNLFVAGSSVFPTTGYSNPTLTIIALTLRLAEHLRAR